MGRRALPAAEKRSERFTIGFTPGERARLEAVAGTQHGDVQRYVAAIALGATVLLWGAAKPTARFRAVVHGREVIATAVVPNDRDLDFEWDLDGDGEPDATGSGPEARHTFDGPGTYEVVLTVRDRRWRTSARAVGEVVVE